MSQNTCFSSFSSLAPYSRLISRTASAIVCPPFPSPENKIPSEDSKSAATRHSTSTTAITAPPPVASGATDARMAGTAPHRADTAAFYRRQLRPACSPCNPLLGLDSGVGGLPDGLAGTLRYFNRLGSRVHRRFRSLANCPPLAFGLGYGWNYFMGCHPFLPVAVGRNTGTLSAL